MRTVVVLGTGTEVGKTYATVQLAQSLATNTANPVLAIKPIESGVRPNETTDAGLLAAASRPVTRPVHAHAFEPAISPHLAARLAGKRLESAHIATWLTQRHREITSKNSNENNPTWILVETAGGVFSPISDLETNFDLAKALEPSCWILVATDALGVLHNVRATLLAMRHLGRVPDILILNSPVQKDGSTGTNRAEIERMGWARVTACIQRGAGFCPDDEPTLLKSLERHFGATALNR